MSIATGKHMEPKSGLCPENMKKSLELPCLNLLGPENQTKIVHVYCNKCGSELLNTTVL